MDIPFKVPIALRVGTDTSHPKFIESVETSTRVQSRISSGGQRTGCSRGTWGPMTSNQAATAPGSHRTNRRDSSVPFIGPHLRVVVCERTTYHKVQRILWSDDLEPGNYRTMRDSSVPFIGPSSSSVDCKGTTNHNAHGHLWYDDPVPDNSIVFSVNDATHRGQLRYPYREAYVRIRPDMQDRVDYRSLPPGPSGSRTQQRYSDNNVISPVQGMTHHGVRLDNQRSPVELPRQVRRRTPPPSSSDEEVLSGDHPVIASPILVSQSHEGGAGLSDRDFPLQQSSANAAQTHRDRTQDKNLSRSQSDIDADKREQAIDH